jgi:hypothetical protein
MVSRASKDTVREALGRQPGELVVTIADAATASGLPLAEAEAALHALVSEYRGHLRVTEEGEILFRFPTRFEKPWETRDALRRFADSVGRGALGVARFVVRAWVAIVLVGYALVFVALLIGLTFTRTSDSREGRSFNFVGVLFRLIAEAFFWTYHPFSPFYMEVDRPVRRAFGGRGGSAERRDATPFYERVDRFFFGPPTPRVDPRDVTRDILAEIRAGKGRIGLADVMRVTGLPREEVDPLMAKLMTDYEGSVEVSEEGGIAYRFPSVRKTALADLPARRQAPIWERAVPEPSLTGHELGSNLLIGGVNAFNLLASAWFVWQGLTLERLVAIFTSTPPNLLPPPGVPIVLGVIPLVFSIALFLLPLARLALHGRKKRKAAEERGRRAVLAGVLENLRSPDGVELGALEQRYARAAGFAPKPAALRDQVLALGGDADVAQLDRGVRYRFADLELERRAVLAEREAAAEEEAQPGKVVFSSED